MSTAALKWKGEAGLKELITRLGMTRRQALQGRGTGVVGLGREVRLDGSIQQSWLVGMETDDGLFHVLNKKWAGRRPEPKLREELLCEILRVAPVWRGEAIRGKHLWWLGSEHKEEWCA